MVSMRKLVSYILGSFLLLAACTSKEEFKHIHVIGHAGNGLDNFTSFYHDNSYESLELALKTPGCDGVEVDVQLAADESLWLYHDQNLESETNGDGCIPNLTESYLSQIKYTSFHQERLIKLDEFPVELLFDKTLYLDLRHFNKCNDSSVDVQLLVSKLVQFSTKNSQLDVIAISNYLPLINELKINNIEVFVSVNALSAYQSFKNELNGVKGVVARYSDLSKEDVSLIRSENCKVILFEMRSVSGIRKALNKLPDAIMTDDLKSAIIEVE